MDEQIVGPRASSADVISFDYERNYLQIYPGAFCSSNQRLPWLTFCQTNWHLAPRCVKRSCQNSYAIVKLC